MLNIFCFELFFNLRFIDNLIFQYLIRPYIGILHVLSTHENNSWIQYIVDG